MKDLSLFANFKKYDMIAGKKLSAWQPFFSGAQFASLTARKYPADEKRRNDYESAADP